jgi:hypothetical protein
MPAALPRLCATRRRPRRRRPGCGPALGPPGRRRRTGRFHRAPRGIATAVRAGPGRAGPGRAGRPAGHGRGMRCRRRAGPAAAPFAARSARGQGGGRERGRSGGCARGPRARASSRGPGVPPRPCGQAMLSASGKDTRNDGTTRAYALHSVACGAAARPAPGGRPASSRALWVPAACFRPGSAPPGGAAPLRLLPTPLRLLTRTPVPGGDSATRGYSAGESGPGPARPGDPARPAQKTIPLAVSGSVTGMPTGRAHTCRRRNSGPARGDPAQTARARPGPAQMASEAAGPGRGARALAGPVRAAERGPWRAGKPAARPHRGPAGPGGSRARIPGGQRTGGQWGGWGRQAGARAGAGAGRSRQQWARPGRPGPDGPSRTARPGRPGLDGPARASRRATASKHPEGDGL